MSYVLDALKKSQSQREQGAVPGIHSLQIPYEEVQGKPRSTLQPLLWAIALLLVLVLVLLAWPTSPEPTPAAVPVAAAVSIAVPAPVPAPEPMPAPVSESLSKGEAQVPVAPNAERTAAKKKVARVYAVDELPESVRRELPALVITGGSYSTNPAQRLIIVNNQVFTERSQPVPGLMVERIEPTAAVLGFRGYLYRVGY